MCFFFFFFLFFPGVTINGQLVGSKKMKNNKMNTYFGTISIYSKTDGVQVIVRTNRIDLMEDRINHSFSWGVTTELILNRYNNTNFLQTFKLRFCPHIICPDFFLKRRQEHS